MRKWLKIIIYIGVINNANALIKEDLYTAKLHIASKDISQEQPIRLKEQAFYEVIRKITGKSNIVDLKLDTKYIDKYLSQYAYHEVNPEQLILKISFDKKAINQELLEHNYKFLGEYRPLTIIWSKSAEIINNQELLKYIESIAKLNGLSIIYPMYDVVDLDYLQNNAVDDVQFIKLIKQASKRYFADEIIFVNHIKEQSGLQFNWRSLSSDWQLNTDSHDYIEHANSLVDNLMQYFINVYVSGSYTAIDKETIIIKISNVINLEDYARVENYLQKLSFIQTIQATKFEPGEVEFEVVANGGKDSIKKAVAGNSMLSNVDYNLPEDNLNVLSYRLQF